MLLKKIPLNKQFYLKSEDLYCKLIKKGEIVFLHYYGDFPDCPLSDFYNKDLAVVMKEDFDERLTKVSNRLSFLRDRIKFEYGLTVNYAIEEEKVFNWRDDN